MRGAYVIVQSAEALCVELALVLLNVLLNELHQLPVAVNLQVNRVNQLLNQESQSVVLTIKLRLALNPRVDLEKGYG